MFEAIIYGLSTGILLSSMLGTVFFLLIQNSIINGHKSSIAISLGVILSDIILIVISYFNANLIPKDGTAEMWVRIIGSAVIIVMGVSSIMKKAKVHYNDTEIPARPNPYILAVKGFSVNLLNPGNLLSWITISALLNKDDNYHYSNTNRIIFYAGALISIFVMEVLISRGAVYLKKFINNTMLNRINMVLGSLLIILAIVLLLPVFKLLF